MANIEIKKNSKLITVLAEQVKGKTQSYENEREAAEIIAELTKEMTPENRHQIAQVMAFTVERLQEKELDFLGQIADVKNVGYGDKVFFDVQTKGIKAYYQARGATTARSYIAERRFTMETQEISARPAIRLADLRQGRINFADLLKQANHEMTMAKLSAIEAVMQAGVKTFGNTPATNPCPWYTQGLTKAGLDLAIAHLKRLGPVTILGDAAAVQQIAPFAGFFDNAGTQHVSDGMVDEYNNTGMLGRYMGCPVLTMENGFKGDQASTILKDNWLYLIPGGAAAAQRPLKVLNEGGVNAFESQNIDDLTYEVRLDQSFGAAFVTGGFKPTIGAIEI